MPTCDVVLEGGGVKGIALVGATQVLHEHGYDVIRAGGTSAGAIVAAFIAARVPPADQVEILRSLDYRRFLDKGWEDRLPVLGPLISLVKDSGVYEGDYLRSWLSDNLAAYGVRTFGDLVLDDPGLSRPPERHSRLVVTASDISSQRLRYLPYDYPVLGRNPDDEPVADAIRASMSIPGFFEPVDVTDSRGGPKTRLIDGFLLSNFPVDMFDRTDGQIPRWPTFGIKLSTRIGSQARRVPVDGPLGTAQAIFNTLLGAHDGRHIDDDSVVARTIFVDSLGVRPTDFGLSRGTAEALYHSGREAAEKFLRTWDWEAYLRTYRGKAPGLPTLAPAPTATTTALPADR